jgi:hypothetical protein
MQADLTDLDLFLSDGISEEGRALLHERFGSRVIFERHEYALLTAGPQGA